MVNLSFDTFVSSHKELVETELEAIVENLACPDILREAMVYSLKAGGKRIRPLLVFAVLDAFGKETKTGLEAACAIEMIHTYSLIHDDLPSMDEETDDEYYFDSLLSDDEEDEVIESRLSTEQPNKTKQENEYESSENKTFSFFD